MNRIFRLVLVAAVATSLVGCSGKQSAEVASSEAVSAGAAASAMTDSAKHHAALIAAAEPFEALTEQAATATPAMLDTLIGDVGTAASGISGLLDQTQRRRLDANLADMAVAHDAGYATGVALAAVEGYRTLVESAGDTGRTPTAVSLLDYAGFRYQANLAPTPPRWLDAAAAVDFADHQWAALSPQVADEPLRDQMNNAIGDMRKAVQTTDPVLAKSASTKELDLVDKLEAYFAAK